MFFLIGKRNERAFCHLFLKLLVVSDFIVIYCVIEIGTPPRFKTGLMDKRTQIEARTFY